MRSGRKNLKRASEENSITLEHSHSIMQVVDLRGSNLIEVMDSKCQKFLTIFPAKFQRSMWMKRGSFVVVDESGREEASESGRKVCGMVTQVLYHKQLRLLQKSPDWPEAFKSALKPDAAKNSGDGEGSNSGDDDEDEGLPPLERNSNRRNPLFFSPPEELDSESDSE